MSPFELHRPDDLLSAVRLLEKYGDDAVLHMGGTELLLLMKLGFAQPGHLIDGKRIADLKRLEVADDRLTIGAGVTHRRIERHRDIAHMMPALVSLEKAVANIRVRNAGTLGGNLCFAEPHSDPATLLAALDATVDLVGPQGGRTLPLREFLIGAFATALAPAEIMTRITVPLPRVGARVGYHRLALKERPTVAAAVVLDDRRCEVWIGALTAKPLPVPEAAAVLASSAGRDVTAAAEATRAAVLAVDAGEGDDYRAQLASVMVRRAVADAQPRLAL
ncbi:FAD binding domain-containing protein [Nocardioides daejeonensis]|uniref:FAD binding domain-containing protein n=1 Tax=Nocardioides daejeonensis TaxID=1046556 RepID=UPI001EF6609A|nr:FAD binding domain-containing protein [Nocardioides daejeonensis]